VWAVGGTDNHTLIVHWNGRKWAEVTSPEVMFGWLGAVSAVSASNVWAVGYTSNAEGTGDFKSLIMHWNGKSWRRDVTVPSVAGRLNDVAAAASGVWAVGEARLRGTALILHWVGGRWYVVPSNVPTATQLLGVTATGAKSAWAVGWTFTNADTVLLRWNGTVWRIIAPPLPYNRGTLEGMAGGPDGTLWVWGQTPASTADSEIGISFLWTGKAWREFSAPGPIFFDDIGAIPGGGFWGVGEYASGESPTSPTLIMHWDGKSWVIVNSPDVPGFPVLLGVAALSSSNAWAVGIIIPNIVDGNSHTLILHWNGKAWR
jgi:hypothetical protein